jgi:hypothetical protein
MKHLNASTTPFDEELEALLHPARVFAEPQDVVNDPDLSLNEKRAILASWASDACAVEAEPALRRPPASGRVVSVDEILEALRTLDKQTGEGGASWERRQVRRASIEAFRASRMRGDPRSSRQVPNRTEQSRRRHDRLTGQRACGRTG